MTCFHLDLSLPKAVVKKIKGMNSKKNLSALVDTIYAQKIDRELDPQVLIGLLEKAGRDIEASRVEFDLADRELAKGKHLETVHTHLLRAVTRLKKLDLDMETSALYISRALKLSNLCYVMGRGITELGEILEYSPGSGDQVG